MDKQKIAELKNLHGELVQFDFQEGGETLILKTHISRELYTIVRMWQMQKDEMMAMEQLIRGLCVHGNVAAVCANPDAIRSAQYELEVLLQVKEVIAKKL
jgi:hypothetical protein